MVIAEPLAIGTNKPISPNLPPKQDLQRPTSIDTIADLIKSAQNANLSSARREQIARQLAEYQRALRQGALMKLHRACGAIIKVMNYLIIRQAASLTSY